MDTISDSEKVPGLLYEGEVDGKSVIVKHYKRKRGGWDQTEKVRIGPIHPLTILYLTACIS
jgi:hypothetical protein